MVLWIVIVIGFVTLLTVAGIVRTNKLKESRLSEIRSNWGKPKTTGRSFKLIASYLNIYSSGINPSSADIDMNELFGFIDRTNSRPGQQLLYKQLHDASSSPDDIRHFESLIQRLNADDNLRENVELKLSSLSNDDAYHLPLLFGQQQASVFGPFVTLYIKLGLPLLLLLLVAFLLTHHQLYFLLMAACLITNLVIHLSNKTKVVGYTHSLPQLLLLHKAATWLQDHELIEGGSDLKTSLKRVTKLRRSLAFISIQNKVVADPTDISYLFSEWLKMFLLIEPLVFIYSINKINRYRTDICEIFLAVAKVDVAISILSLPNGLPHYCVPQLTIENTITVNDLYHPLVENCVSNSISINNNKSVLITGSNMSGKTTFIRSLAVNALVSKTLNTSFSSYYSAPDLNVFTSININDDLAGHTSYFQAEAISIKNIIQNCLNNQPTNNLVIIDEIFRGTNTIERIAAAKAVLSYFVSQCIFIIVSTHDLELTELLGDECAVFSFTEVTDDNGVHFDYRIKQGLQKNTNGIEVLKRLDYPPTIIDDAMKIADRLRGVYKIS